MSVFDIVIIEPQVLPTKWQHEGTWQTTDAPDGHHHWYKITFDKLLMRQEGDHWEEVAYDGDMDLIGGEPYIALRAHFDRGRLQWIKRVSDKHGEIVEG